MTPCPINPTTAHATTCILPREPGHLAAGVPWVGGCTLPDRAKRGKLKQVERSAATSVIWTTATGPQTIR